MHKTRQQLQQANDQLTQLDCLNSHLRSSISALQRQEEERVAAADQLTQAAEESTSLLSQRIKEHEATIGRLKIQLEQQARGGAHRHEVQVQTQQINIVKLFGLSPMYSTMYYYCYLLQQSQPFE